MDKKNYILKTSLFYIETDDSKQAFCLGKEYDAESSISKMRLHFCNNVNNLDQLISITFSFDKWLSLLNMCINLQTESLFKSNVNEQKVNEHWYELYIAPSLSQLTTKRIENDSKITGLFPSKQKRYCSGCRKGNHFVLKNYSLMGHIQDFELYKQYYLFSEIEDNIQFSLHFGIDPIVSLPIFIIKKFVCGNEVDQFLFPLPFTMIAEIALILHSFRFDSTIINNLSLEKLNHVLNEEEKIPKYRKKILQQLYRI